MEMNTPTLEEQLAHQDSCKLYWDNFSIRQTAKREGHKEGKIEGKIEGKEEVVVNMLKTGKFSDEDIAQAVGKDVKFVLNVKEARRKHK